MISIKPLSLFSNRSSSSLSHILSSLTSSSSLYNINHNNSTNNKYNYSIINNGVPSNQVLVNHTLLLSNDQWSSSSSSSSWSSTLLGGIRTYAFGTKASRKDKISSNNPRRNKDSNNKKNENNRDKGEKNRPKQAPKMQSHKIINRLDHEELKRKEESSKKPQRKNNNTSQESNRKGGRVGISFNLEDFDKPEPKMMKQNQKKISTTNSDFDDGDQQQKKEKVVKTKKEKTEANNITKTTSNNSNKNSNDIIDRRPNADDIEKKKKKKKKEKLEDQLNSLYDDDDEDVVGDVSAMEEETKTVMSSNPFSVSATLSDAFGVGSTPMPTRRKTPKKEEDDEDEKEKIDPAVRNLLLKKRDPPIYTHNGLYATRKVLPDLANMRVDRWLRIQFPVMTHSLICKLLRKGLIQSSNQLIQSPSQSDDDDIDTIDNDGDDDAKEKNDNESNNNELSELKQNDRTVSNTWIYVPSKYAKEQREADQESPDKYIRLSDAEIAAIKNSVLYKDDDILVINKPPGLSVQGGTGLKKHLDMMLAHLKFDSEETPRLVHRLDKDTSGILILGRNRTATTAMAAKFEQKMKRRSDRQDKKEDKFGKKAVPKPKSTLDEIKEDNSIIKTYWALLAKTPNPREGRIRAPLQKIVENGQEKVVATKETGDGAKLAITEYKVIESSMADASFVALWPETGRTHQLRVHCASVLGSPIIGDVKYGNKKSTEPFKNVFDKNIPLHLHARRVQFYHPTNSDKLIDVIAPLPPTLHDSWYILGFNPNTKDSEIKH